MKRAYGYIRVSKDPRQDKVSPEAQRTRIRQEARRKRWELAEMFEDLNVPGAGVDRPGWHALMIKVERGDVIVCNEFTRIGRNLRETLARIEELHERGVEIVSLEGDLDTTTAAGKLQYQVLLVLAEFERNRMSERLQQAHAQIAREGRWKGGGTPPLGYTFTPGDKMLRIQEDEAATVRRIYELRDQGYGVNLIVRELAGVPGKKGRLSYSSVKQILRNPTYTGKRVHKGEVYPGLHEAIIDENLWQRVQARNRAAPGGAGGGLHLLSGFIYCGDCGSKMVHQAGGKSGRKYYGCKRAREYRTGSMVTIEEHLVHQWVTKAFCRRLDEPKIQAAKERARRRQPKRESKLEGLEKRLAKVDRALERLVADYYETDPPPLAPEQFRRQNASLLEQRLELEKQLQSLRDEAVLDNVVYLTDHSALLTLRETWDELILDEQREALRLLVEKVTVFPRTPGKKLEPERLKITWK